VIACSVVTVTAAGVGRENYPADVDMQELTVAAEELSEGQWFFHEPVPGVPVPGLRSWPLQAAAVQVGEKTVRIVTTDDVREVVSYRRGRRVRVDPDR
jgi:hypothetical protein